MNSAMRQKVKMPAWLPYTAIGDSVHAEGLQIADCSMRVRGAANAEFFARACNAHDALVEALDSTLRAFKTLCWNHPDDAVANVVIEIASAALLKARPK